MLHSPVGKGRCIHPWSKLSVVAYSDRDLLHKFRAHLPSRFKMDAMGELHFKHFSISLCETTPISMVSFNVSVGMGGGVPE